VSYLSTAKKALEEHRRKQQGGATPSDVTPVDPMEGRIIAVKISSHVLDACIWLAFDDGFTPDDDEPLAVFYADEIPLLKDKTMEQLKEIHKVKLTFGPRSMVSQ
jgi:hypothetical protein